MCQLNNFKNPWVNNQLWARMTQSNDKMGAHSTLQNIIPTERMGNIIEEEKHFTLYFWVNGFPAHRSVVFEEKRNYEVNGRALWCVCPWSTSVNWLQDSGGVSELKMDFSSLLRPTDWKKDWRPKLIGFVTDRGTAERWLQSDKIGSSLKFPKVMHMMLLTPGWGKRQSNRRPLDVLWFDDAPVTLLRAHTAGKCFSCTVIKGPPHRIKPAKLCHIWCSCTSKLEEL